MADCVFCKIIAGELDSFKIYEDDFCVAFLDIANDIYGHTLVVPKKHVKNMLTCDSSTLAKVIDVCKKIGKHYVDNCGFDGFNLLCANEEAAEQSVFHLHFHILPRKKGDNHKVFPHLSYEQIDLKEVQEILQIKPEPAKSLTTQFDEEVILYTDGACSGNPGAGGWGSILSYKGVEKILTGGEAHTTNNRMELMAVIEGLEAIKSGSVVKVFSDSAYVVNAFNQKWIESWQKNNWKTASKGEVQNQDLWQRMLAAKANLTVEFIKVKGHSDNEFNNRCDALARAEILKLG